jgi:diaminohydroxyphosphoribosylaminopyrimidine deaminase/5-amino-6-(5-phosphoribosylamino)uracil reductase
LSAPADLAGMAIALRSAVVGLGAASPNPCVGAAVIGPSGALLGSAGHERAGAAHAERIALAQAGGGVAGATVFVTLEPCCHHGRQPPCIDALIAAAPARLVVGMTDPDKRVAGAGIAALRAAGMAVEVGVDEAACAVLNPGYLHRQRTAKARLLLKTAVTLEGAAATHSGDSQWITGPEARRAVHALRARVAAVLVGGGTARHDHPNLSVRLEQPLPWWRGGDHQPRRLVASVTGAVPAPAGDGGPTWLLSPVAAPGFDRHFPCAAPIDWPQLLTELAAAGVNEVLCEGGATLAASLLAAGVVSEWIQFVAPTSLGGSGLPVVAAPGVDQLGAARRGHLARLSQLGQDACLWTVFDSEPSFAGQTDLLERLEDG